ncbi:MAG: response regulator transcription factor [Planctomycetes bacterium]|nr:response regulator transcription factor [Planctomycetota bacterium]MCB9869075.1 response regulator transcription factor [Planctomycetota bacterium]MCB9888033.1 response regulator transcription factor [Planctomycetota bacterium]
MTRWILVVEDEAPLGEMLCDNLQMEGYGTELITTGPAAEARLERGGFDLLILDIMLPGVDGFTILRNLRGRGDETPVMIVSARIGDNDRIRGLELKADDYLTKPFNLKELLLRVAALLRRQPAVAAGADMLEFAGNRVDFRSHRVESFRGEHAQLTPTEVKLLRVLASRDEQVVSRRELVDHLFGPHTPTTTRSLDNMLLNLRRLFEPDRDNPRHFHTVRGVGLRFSEKGNP